MEHPQEQLADTNLAIPYQGGWTLLPLLAAAGGAWAFNQELWADNLTTLGVMLALIAGSWQPLWRALTRTDWASPLARWTDWSAEAPMLHWPYVQPGTPGDHLRHRLSLAKAWWRDVGRLPLAHAIQRAVGTLLVGILLSLALGRMSLLLTLIVLALAELATLWHEGRGAVGALWTGITMVAIPWFLGASLDAPGSIVLPAISSVALALMIGLYIQPNGWALVGPLIGAALLLWRGNASAVGWLLLLAIPGLMVLTARPSRKVYRRAVGTFVLAMVVLMAWAL